jgi:hypothetical protein
MTCYIYSKVTSVNHVSVQDISQVPFLLLFCRHLIYMGVNYEVKHTLRKGYCI